MTYRLFVAALAAATLPLAPAAAQTERVTQAIVTHDLDLSRPSHRATLDHRLVHASRAMCGEASSLDIHGQSEVRECRKAVLRDARAQRDAIVARIAEVSVAAK